MGNSAPKKRGRPPFVPTDEQRYSVEIMAAIGIPEVDLAAAIKIAPKTLRKHFRDELDLGATRANSKVAESLFRQALAGNVSAAIFWCKTRLGWKETDVHEHKGNIVVEQVIADAESFARAMSSLAARGAEASGDGETQH